MTVILLLSAGMSAGNHNCFSVKIHDDVFFEDRETFSVVLDSLETESGEAVPDLMSVLRQRTEVIITDDESELYCVCITFNSNLRRNLCLREPN